MTTLGHVVFYVRDLQTSVNFYTDIVGLNLKGFIFNKRAALLSGGSTHHELLLIQVGSADGPLQGKRIGLYHVGWHVGDSLATLKALYEKLRAIDYPVAGLSDHTISQSIYLRDPDGEIGDTHYLPRGHVHENKMFGKERLILWLPIIDTSDGLRIINVLLEVSYL